MKSESAKELLIIGLAACLLLLASQTQADVYANQVELVAGTYTLYWNYTDSNITALIAVRTLGWVSFGISRQGKLYNSDLFVAWVTNYGTKTYFIDSHFDGNYTIMPDELQNWQLLDSFEYNGTTYIKFTRYIKLTPFDPYNDVDIETGAPNVTYSWGLSDPVNFINYNTPRSGLQPVPLITGLKDIPGDSASSIEYHYYATTNHSLPNSQANYFYCEAMTAPANTSYRALQIIQYYTRISSGNTKYLNSWKMWVCPNLTSTSGLPTAGECDPLSTNSSQVLWRITLQTTCNMIGLVWSKGNFLTISFPKDYGYPYGIGGGYFFDTFVLQMHYINNDLDQSVYDNSAVVFTVTSHLRTYNISTLAIGGTVNWQALAIPPKTDLMRTYFYCFSSCINSMVLQQTDDPVGRINIIANILHTYQSGTKVESILVRQNKEYSYIGRNRYYNSGYQYINYLNQTISLTTDDEIITTCEYDTTSLSSFQYGGRNELCMNVMFYYPANKYVYRCLSQPSLESWAYMLGLFNAYNYIDFVPTGYSYLTYLSDGNNTIENAISIISSIKYYDEYTKGTFLQFYYSASHVQICNTDTAGSSAIAAISPTGFLVDSAHMISPTRLYMISTCLVILLPLI